MEPRSVLAVGASPSDVEFFAGACIAGLARRGASICLVVCTDGTRGLGGEAEAMANRRQETERAAETLGAEIVLLGRPEGELEADDRLRRQLVREIRRSRPELVLCHDPTTRWSRRGDVVRLGHSDHRAAGEATLDAIHPRAELRSYYPELADRGLAPWLVRELWLFDTPHPDHFVDISGTAAVKHAALACHTSQSPRRLIAEAEALTDSSRERWGLPAEQFRKLPLL